MVRGKKVKCFVIMPFSKTTDIHTKEYWDGQFTNVLKPRIESTHPLVVERSRPLRGDVLRQIITDIITAEVVIADVTDSNANVYWELGVRQSFKHGTITIAEFGTALPFDLGTKGTLFYYPTDHIKMEDLFFKPFHVAIEDCLKNPNSPDSHVLETIGGRGTLYQIIARDESVRKLEAVISEIDYNIQTLGEIVSCCTKNQKEIDEAKAKGEKPLPNIAVQLEQ